jgi:hypothetical protein
MLFVVVYVLTVSGALGVCCVYRRLIPVFIVQVYNTFSKISPSTSMHFATHVRTWCVACLYSVLYSEIARISETIRNMMYIYTFLFRMTYTVTSQTFPPGTSCM